MKAKPKSNGLHRHIWRRSSRQGALNGKQLRENSADLPFKAVNYENDWFWGGGLWGILENLVADSSLIESIWGIQSNSASIYSKGCALWATSYLWALSDIAHATRKKSQIRGRPTQSTMRCELHCASNKLLPPAPQTLSSGSSFLRAQRPQSKAANPWCQFCVPSGWRGLWETTESEEMVVTLSPALKEKALDRNRITPRPSF